MSKMRPFYLCKTARDLILEKQNDVWNSTNNYLILIHKKYIIQLYLILLGTAVTQWLMYCATNRKVAGSIPAGIIRIFH